MTEAAKKYFELYYKIQRCIDENAPESKVKQIKQDMNEHYKTMTEKERQMLDIVGVQHENV